jgi:hypothetical protein
VSVELGTVVIDCSDPEASAEFWYRVLDWHIIGRDDDGAVEIGAVEHGSSSPSGLEGYL